MSASHPHGIGDGGKPLRLVAAGLILMTGIACRRAEPPPKPRDILLVTIDTARADRFAHAGAAHAIAPRVDALAEQGAGFANAISPVPLTLPAHASLMTGRQPPSHTVRDNGSYRLPASETTLAEALAAAGFVTGAFLGAEVLDARYGLDQGFATYDDDVVDRAPAGLLYYPERPAGEVVEAALRWMESQDDRPLFAWVHLFDPHTPYRPPEPERSRHASPYDGEIAYVDRSIGELLDRWNARRPLERTLVVVTADHGEALGEHGENTHGVLVHDATIRVPLVIRAPGLRAAGPIRAPVSLVDVMPTMLGLVGLPVPEGVQGRDLGPLLRGEALAWSPVSGYSESLYASLHHRCAPLRALRAERWKVVHGVAHEVYDIIADPRELRDLAAIETARRDSMAAALEALAAELARGHAERVPVDDESRRALAALGYLSSSAPPARDGGPLRDPRDALRSLGLMADADRHAVAGDVEGAIARYRELLREEPESVDARVRLSEMLVARGRGAEAVGLLEQAASIAPQEPFLHRRLGAILEASGRPAEALAAYERGLAIHPSSRELRNGRWSSLNRLDRRREMLAEADRAVAADPRDGAARYARALACCGQGAVETYIAALERELAELPGDRILEAAIAKARAEAASTRPPR